jgi:hypothetical protein
VLRLLCALCGYAPWRYARFLDYAAERILLRRVGGSYIFVHRMLLEYFASVEIAEPQPATSNPAIPTNDNLTSKQLPDIDTLNNIAPELPSLTQLTNETEQPLIRDNSGQVAVGSNIAQASGSGSAHVDSSRSVFDQRGQHVGGSQYNAARDMNIGREHQEPRRPNLSDRRLAQAVQAALERHGLDEVLFNLGSYAEFMVNIDTLGADVAAQARNLVTLCRSNKQRSALVASLRDFEDGLLGSPEEEDAWLAWAQEMDSR